MPRGATDRHAARASIDSDDDREKRLLSDRLAAVDTLAAGLAHEINNPLTYSLLNVEHVLRRMRALSASSPGPAAAKEWTAAAGAPRAESGCPRRVLVLDDDTLVGEGLARALSDVAEVTTLTDARVAVERLASGERWDAILCDLAMSHISGMDVYREILRVAPEVALRVIFMTAGAVTERGQSFLDSVRNVCLEKPFDVARVRSLVTLPARERG